MCNNQEGYQNKWYRGKLKIKWCHGKIEDQKGIRKQP
jgi:hypothetical protein